MRKRKRYRTYLVYALLILLSANWFADRSLAKAEEAIHATLSGEDTVLAGQAFNLTYGLKGVTDDVYAQDITVIYDAEQLDFNGVDSLKDNFSIAGLSETPGQVRIIAVSHGAKYAIHEDSELLTLRWTSKSLNHAAMTNVTISNTVVSNGDGVEINVSGATHTVSIRNSQPEDLNEDNKFSIGDLAIAAASYGKTSADSDWANHVKADLHADGRIDILDLAIIAKAIWNSLPDLPKPPEWTAEKRLDVSDVSSTGVTLNWSGATTDPVGVTGYQVYQDGEALGTVTGSVYQYAITALKPNTVYTFKVEAGNASGLWSTNGPILTVTTQANSSPSDLNSDNKISVGDLAIVAASYGSASTDDDWAKHERADISRNEKVDIEDLAMIASEIFR
jgi:chitodextrinase